MATKPASLGRRIEICRRLGLSGVARVHELVSQGPRRGAIWLRRWGFDVNTLVELGYTREAMERLGFSREALAELGYIPPSQDAPAEHTAQDEVFPRSAPGKGVSDEKLRRLLAAGTRASELAALGYKIHHLKRTGMTAGELAGLGFELDALAQVCSAAELRRADFKPRELRNRFSGHELRAAGFSAFEMRLSGYSVGDLLQLGYNENHIRTAGFSTTELLREGLTRTTRHNIQ